MPVLKEDLISYLKSNNYRKELWFDLSPEEIFDKIFRLNAMNFLIKNFNDRAL